MVLACRSWEGEAIMLISVGGSCFADISDFSIDKISKRKAYTDYQFMGRSRFRSGAQWV
jgi:hypothetical protein